MNQVATHQQRRRLTPEQRRAQLLDVGLDVLSLEDFEQLTMDEIAQRAGVTRTLIYHYFPTKTDYFAAVWQRLHETVQRAVRLEGGRTVRDWLVALLAAHLDFYYSHPQYVSIANRSSISTAPAVRGAVSAGFANISRIALDASGCKGHLRDLADTAFGGWVSFVRETAAYAAIDAKITPEENYRMCVAVLDATVAKYADLARPTPQPCAEDMTADRPRPS